MSKSDNLSSISFDFYSNNTCKILTKINNINPHGRRVHTHSSDFAYLLNAFKYLTGHYTNLKLSFSDFSPSTVIKAIRTPSILFKCRIEMFCCYLFIKFIRYKK